MASKEHDFSVGSIPRNIISLALPMTAAQLINVLYSVVDRIYLGRLPGHLALTGLGLTLPIISIVMGFANLCGVEHKKYKLLSTVFVDITPIKNLTVRAQFGADYSHSTSFMKSYPSYIINNNSGRAGRSSSDILNLTETLTANYRWTLKDDHSFNFMLGQEGIDYRSTGFQVVTRAPRDVYWR